MTHHIAKPDYGASNAMPVILLDWQPLAKGSLRGFAKVMLGRSLMISDVPVNVSNGRAWASLPSKPVIAAGQHVIADNGKPAYRALLEWTSATARNRFSDSVVAALLAVHPGALGDPS